MKVKIIIIIIIIIINIIFLLKTFITLITKS